MQLKKFNLTTLMVVAFSILCQACNGITLDESLASPTKNITRNEALLLSIPKRAGTVGTILVAEKEGKLYILLARESIDSPIGKENDPKWLAKKGTFSDLGGSTEHDTTKTFLDHLQRELQEESMGMIQLEDKAIIENALVIHKISPKKDRDIIYIVYLAKSSREFVSQEAFNEKRRVQAITLPEESLEKDLFLWCEITPFLEKDVPEEIEINDLHGEHHIIKLRKFFIQDVLTEDFRKIITSLQKRI